MHGEHDRTHGHGLRARPRGRMPYSDPPLRQPPSPAEPPHATGLPGPPEPAEPPRSVRPPEPAEVPRPLRPPESRTPAGQALPVEWPGRREGEGARVPRGPARHRKDDDADDADDADNAVTCSPVHRSRTYLDSRPFSMPPPPSPWRRPWSRLSRDQLLRPALIAGFLAAAGVGVWSSGWSPWEGVPTAGTSPAPPGERRFEGHDVVITPSRGPVAAGVDAKAPAGKRRAPEGRRGSDAEGAGGERRIPGRDPVRVLPAERALSAAAGNTRDEWVERVERAKSVKRPVKPVDRARRHREGGGSARAAAGSGGTGAATPESGTRRGTGGAGQESGRTSRSAGQESGRGNGSTGRGAGNTGGDAGTAGRSRSGSGAQEGRSKPRAGRTGAPVTRSPSPSASRSRPPATGGGGSAGISAAYACRHLPSGDWRHAYCVRVWNDYKDRNGLP